MLRFFLEEMIYIPRVTGVETELEFCNSEEFLRTPPPQIRRKLYASGRGRSPGTCRFDETSRFRNGASGLLRGPVSAECERLVGPIHWRAIAASIYEREGRAIYNTAVLIGRNGELVGKYRKVYLPYDEPDDGVTPGNDYPVFQPISERSDDDLLEFRVRGPGPCAGIQGAEIS